MNLFFFPSIWPLLMDTLSVLVQRTPKEIEYELPIAYQRVSLFPYYFIKRNTQLEPPDELNFLLALHNSNSQ